MTHKSQGWKLGAAPWLWLICLGFSFWGLGACAKTPDPMRARNERRVPPAAETIREPSSNASDEERMKPNESKEVAILAGGCFWGMEDLLRRIDGVLDTEVGYAGGASANPVYETVKTGRTGHAESVRVVFDPNRISFAELLEKWFFRMHDPTTKDRQGNDRGTQYRSAIFAMSEEQARVAREVIQRVDQSGVWGAPIVTEVVNAGPFTPAEDYHQDYLQEHPGGYTCHYLRNF